MRRRKLERLRRDLEGLRRQARAVRPQALIRFANAVGRKLGKRGKEPTYVREGWLPLSIPNHPGTLAVGTAISIIDTLSNDLDELELTVEDEEQDQDQDIEAGDEDGTEG
jgi:hypothetical protein